MGKGRNFFFGGKATQIEECPSWPPSPPCRGLGRIEGNGPRPTWDPDHTYDYPEGYLQMDFSGANLTINNLGGYCANADETNDCTDIVQGFESLSSDPILLYTDVGLLRKAAFTQGTSPSKVLP